MANPQKENGHTAIAHEIVEAISSHKFTVYQLDILLVILRKTYGWQKKTDWIANSQFVQITGISKGHVSRTVKQLKDLNVVTSTGNKNIGINKNYDEWKVTSRGNTVTSVGNNSYLHRNHKRKETIQKKGEDKSSRLSTNKKTMKEYEEPTVDMDTGEITKHVPKDSIGKKVVSLIHWAEDRRNGNRFTDQIKQRKAIKMMREAGISVDRIKTRWVKLSNDSWYKEKGFDFMDVSNNFNKKA